MISYLPFGDSAVLINFEQRIDTEINAQVIAFANAIKIAALDQTTFYTPAYCSLAVGFNKNHISFMDFVSKLKNIHENRKADIALTPTRTLSIPVCYEHAFAPDMKEVTAQTGLDKNEVIRTHSNLEYQVFMLGFLPGFPYMGKLLQELYSTRKLTPALKVAAGAVGLAGEQTGIYPCEAPGGWQIIGRTPLKLFNITPELAFLFEAGDRVKFEPISKRIFESIAKDIAVGSFNWSSIYV